jgi:Tol biopolymer transport system component
MDMKKDKSLTRVYSIPMNGGEPIAITGKDYSGSQPRWSPDNKYLSFLARKKKMIKHKFGFLTEWEAMQKY